MAKKSTKAPPSKPTTSTPTTTPPTSTPNWPPFKPPLPITTLTPTPHPAAPSKIVTLSTFFPKSLCRDYVSFLRTLPLVTTPGRPRRGEAVRVNDRFQVVDEGFAERLWGGTGLGDLVRGGGLEDLWGGEVVGLNPNIRVYRYTKGQFFDCHYDDTNHTTLHTQTGTPTPCKTTWTLLLYLTSPTEGCHGGETVFYTRDRKSAKEEIVVAPETGMVLLHKHGDDCMLHEGREVTAGEKWILRTDLCVRK